MVNKKAAAIFLAVAVLIGLEFNKTYVPENFENRFGYKVFTFIFKGVQFVSKAVSKLGYDSEQVVFRKIAHKLFPSGIKDHELVNIEDTKIANVPVRIYSLKASQTEKNLPSMIYYHGGGFVIGNPQQYDDLVVYLVTSLNIVVISIDYRLSPEHPFPTPTDDCYAVTKYIFKNPSEFRIDTSRVVTAGDSAGGAIVAAINQRLLADKGSLPKLQVFFYPWTQLFNWRLPAYSFYSQHYTFALTKFAAAYLGIADVTEEIDNAILSNNITALLTDKAERKRLEAIYDLANIPDQYKSGEANYKIKASLVKPEELDANNILIRDKNLAKLFQKLYDPRVSPLLAKDHQLVGLPKAYFVTLEWDFLKDDGLLYAERLRKLGVEVELTFYENAYHGIIAGVNDFKIARKMVDDLIAFLKLNL